MHCDALDRAESVPGGCCQHFTLYTLCCPVYAPYIRCVVARAYGIEEDECASIASAIVCPACSCVQVSNTVLVHEHLTWGCCGVDVSTALAVGGPETIVDDKDLDAGRVESARTAQLMRRS